MVRKLKNSIRYLIDDKSPHLAALIRAFRDRRELERSDASDTPHGFRFIGHEGVVQGWYEKREVEIVEQLIPDADVFVDVGANLGFYSCLAKKQGLRVLAFEPHPRNLNYLYRNLGENGWDDVEIFPIGLAESPGVMTLFGFGDGASLVQGWAHTSTKLRHHIPVNTLDNLVVDRLAGKKLLVKIDVEGAEHQVLSGARRVLDMDPRPVWFIEVCLDIQHPGGLNPHFEQTFEMMWEAGYRSRVAVQEEIAVGRREITDWVRKRRVENGWINFLFFPE